MTDTPPWIAGCRAPVVLRDWSRKQVACQRGHDRRRGNVYPGGHAWALSFTHDDTIGDYVTICSRVVLGGGVKVGDFAYLGIAASVREKVVVGPHCVLGMGAVFT